MKFKPKLTINPKINKEEINNQSHILTLERCHNDFLAIFIFINLSTLKVFLTMTYRLREGESASSCAQIAECGAIFRFFRE